MFFVETIARLIVIDVVQIGSETYIYFARTRSRLGRFRTDGTNFYQLDVNFTSDDILGIKANTNRNYVIYHIEEEWCRVPLTPPWGSNRVRLRNNPTIRFTPAAFDSEKNYLFFSEKAGISNSPKVHVVYRTTAPILDASEIRYVLTPGKSGPGSYEERSVSLVIYNTFRE
jgi:hypothetical protein